MFKILFILSLIVLSSIGFTSQQNEYESIPFTVFSSTGFFTAPKNVDVLQDPLDLPKQAIMKSERTILQSNIASNRLPPSNILADSKALLGEITSIYEEIELTPYKQHKLALSALKIPIENFYKIIETYEIRIENRIFAGLPELAFVTSLPERLKSLATTLDNLSALRLGTINSDYEPSIIDSDYGPNLIIAKSESKIINFSSAIERIHQMLMQHYGTDD